MLDSWRAWAESLGGQGSPQFVHMITGLVLAFILGQATAWVYMFTHKGLSYSRAYVQSVVLLAVIVSLSMMVIGNNIMVAFGLIGALAVIRFRNILKDTRDTAFIFFALVAGMASGTGDYWLAICGTVFFCAVLLYLHWVDFGTRHLGDGLVRFNITVPDLDQGSLQQVLRRHCSRINLLSQRIEPNHQGEMAYRLVMRNPLRAGDMVEELERLPGLSNLSFVLQEEELEV